MPKLDCTPRVYEVHEEAYIHEASEIADDVRGNTADMYPEDIADTIGNNDAWGMISLSRGSRYGEYVPDSMAANRELLPEAIYEIQDIRNAVDSIAVEELKIPAEGMEEITDEVNGFFRRYGMADAALRQGIDPIAAHRMMHMSLQTVYHAARKNGNELGSAEYLDTLAKHDAVMKYLAGDEAGSRAALRQGFKPPNMDPHLYARQRIERAGGSDFVNSHAAATAMPVDMPQMLKMTGKTNKDLNPPADTLKQRFRETSYEVWVNSMLSNPYTHAMNIGGTGVNAMLQVPTRYLVGGILAGDGLSSAVRTTHYALYGMVEGIADGLRISLANMYAELGPRRLGQDGVRKYLQDRNLLVQSEVFAQVSKAEDRARMNRSGVPDAIVRKASQFSPVAMHTAEAMDTFLNRLLTAPTKLMQAADMFFKTMAYRSNMYAQAARLTENIPNAGQRQARMRELMDNPTSDMLEQAHKDARFLTFTEDVEAALPKAVERGMDKWPFGRIILPFRRTLSNITARAGEFTPGMFYFMSGRARRLIRENGGPGNLKAWTSPEVRRELYSRQIVGGIAVAAAYKLYEEGILTMPPAPNSFYGNIHQQAVPPLSVKVGENTYLALQEVFGPIAPAFASIGYALQAMQAADEVELEDPEVQDGILQNVVAAGSLLVEVGGGTTRSLMESSYLPGFMENIELLMELGTTAIGHGKPGSSVMRQLGSGFIRTVDGFVPYKGLSQWHDMMKADGDVVRAPRAQGGAGDPHEDPVEFMTEVVRQIGINAQSRIHILSENADKYPVRSQLTGKPLTKALDGNDGQVVKQYLLGRFLQRGETGPLANAIRDVQESGNMVDVQKPRRYMPVKHTDGRVISSVEMLPDEYDYLTKRAGEYMEVLGTRLVSSPGYLVLRPEHRALAIAAQVRQAQTLARRELMMVYPGLRARMWQSEQAARYKEMQLQAKHVDNLQSA